MSTVPGLLKMILTGTVSTAVHANCKGSGRRLIASQPSQLISSSCDGDTNNSKSQINALPGLPLTPRRRKTPTGKTQFPCLLPVKDVGFLEELRRLLRLQNVLEQAGVKGNDRAGGLAGQVTVTSGLRLGRSEVLRILRHYRCSTKPRT